MKFAYLPYETVPSPAKPGVSIVYRPVIRVRMIGPRAIRKVWALVDTGADESYITERLAQKIGVQRISEASVEITAAAGTMRAWYGKVEVEVIKNQEQRKLAIVVGVVPEDWSFMLLGRTGFLEHFDATFQPLQRTLTLVDASSEILH